MTFEAPFPPNVAVVTFEKMSKSCELTKEYDVHGDGEHQLYEAIEIAPTCTPAVMLMDWVLFLL